MTETGNEATAGKASQAPSTGVELTPFSDLDPATTDLVYTVSDHSLPSGPGLQCVVVASAAGVEVSVDLFGNVRAEASESIDDDTWSQLVTHVATLAEHSDASHDSPMSITDGHGNVHSELRVRCDGRTAFTISSTHDGDDHVGSKSVLKTFIGPMLKSTGLS